ncbi:hypothetical protein EJ05DRAFT_488946 [Pseudovirgaria hyperparasitica]|uniref:Uncharacterized protein n=1 Tax=Pseudovirgaria hyperparasitica TaxID=470096 RepID=A0A6A6VW37_9PEZI|nr:uncharacterized protein EJ05DRAFT_488946 [Pseudovirgaria hyperparasitica]KAF2754802.1 hypothetical protein EJ05DRAFT_488946 [Pseudovirgaria hyperparasitica]
MGRSSRFGFTRRKSNASSNLVTEERVPIVRIDGSISNSKAERLLGHARLPVTTPTSSPAPLHTATPSHHHHHHNNSRRLAPNLPIPATTADLSYEPEATPYDSTERLVLPPQLGSLRPPTGSRASSNALGIEDYSAISSVTTSTLHHVSHKNSSSTIRSYYDSKRIPLSVSQQTSNSAVRDMALRKGYTPVHISTADEDSKSTTSASTASKSRKEKSSRKPSRLDLSKLFPRPRAHQHDHNGLLSPNKFVNSPSQISLSSEYFARGQNQYTKSIRSQASTDSSLRQPSPNIRSADPLERAKTNVRRPPKGVQHWFDALSSDEDDTADTPTPTEQVPIKLPRRKSSLGKVLVNGQALQWEKYQMSGNQDLARKEPAPSDIISPTQQQRPAYPSRKSSAYSVTSNLTEAASARTKESRMAQLDLRTTSALSMSSSEGDNGEDTASAAVPLPTPVQIPVRESLMSSAEGEIIIGKAHAYEVTPGALRHPSNRSNVSARTTSSSKAGTIQMVYAPAPSLPLPQTDHASSRRADLLPSRSRSVSRHESSSTRDDRARPRTSGLDMTTETEGLRAESESIRSSKSAKSETRSRDGHKLMAVTEEEEALLEMMRQKRAAMAKQSFSQGFQTAIGMGRYSRQDASDDKPTDEQQLLADKTTDTTGTSAVSQAVSPSTEMINAFPAAPTPITSTFFSDAATPSPPRDRVPLPQTDKHRPSRIITSSRVSSSDILRSGALGQNPVPVASSGGPKNCSHTWRDAVTSDARPATAPSYAAQLDHHHHHQPLPSPSNTGSIASASISAPSPLPSPATPGTTDDDDLRVKVANSEPSLSGDDDSVIPAHSVVDFISPVSSTNRVSLVGLSEKGSQSTLGMPGRGGGGGGGGGGAPPTALRECSLDHALDLHAIPVRTASRRTNASTLSGRSAGSRSSVRRESKMFRNVNRESLAPTVDTRCSVSEDVLAAWGSLGGWRDYDLGGSAKKGRV